MKRSLLCLAVIVGIALPATSLAQEYPAPQPKPPTPPAEEPAPAPEQAGEVVAPLAEGMDHEVIKTDAMKYEPLEVPGFDPGLSLAVIHGNPGAESGDYTVRLKLPAGYRFPAHWHPKAEHLTVLDGTFLLAMGESGDPAVIQSYSPGDFLYIPAENPHYGGAEGETVIQLHGEAPFKIMLVETGS